MRIVPKCGKKDFFSSRNKLLSFKKWREEFDPFSETLKATTL